MCLLSTDLAFLDGLALADLIRRGEASPAELTDAAIRRIELLNPKIGAVVLTDFDRARKEAF